MLAAWPALCIHAYIAKSAVTCPSAMFWPHIPGGYPAALISAVQLSWANFGVRAIHVLWYCAALFKRRFRTTGLIPRRERSRLTSRKMSPRSDEHGPAVVETVVE